MSQAIDQAEDLRKRAIEILLIERTAIDERLAMLSYDTAGAPKHFVGQASSVWDLWEFGPQCASLPGKNGPDGSPADANL